MDESKLLEAVAFIRIWPASAGYQGLLEYVQKLWQAPGQIVQEGNTWRVHTGADAGAFDEAFSFLREEA